MNRVKFLLASASPRRVELLNSCHIDFEQVNHTFDEDSVDIKDPIKLARELAYGKALSAAQLSSNFERYVIGVDTVVAFEELILGKPQSSEEARANILRLSGKRHEVISGISLINQKKGIELTEHAVSEVYFKEIDGEFLKFYLDNNHWSGYAGGYAIQGIFSLVIDRIEGSYTNIVGLPVEKLYSMLKSIEIDIFNNK